MKYSLEHDSKEVELLIKEFGAIEKEFVNVRSKLIDYNYKPIKEQITKLEKFGLKRSVECVTLKRFIDIGFSMIDAGQKVIKQMHNLHKFSNQM